MTNLTNLAIAAAGVAVIAITVGVVMYGRAQHERGWRQAAAHVATDIRAFRNHQLGRTGAIHIAVEVCDALNEAANLANYHALYYKALPASYSTQATSPVGVGKHHRV